ncbi:hypothetical protein TRAPUB_5700 [Trametes pubescens]|uniref:Uncharacterized protein n=1 Tax=Trametes pubescens TaxID=154538 RepID=A0A1M2V7U0_TRAPU|nr:hypothetical protein TRAPUB_5700 [Trametes pubescens]
MSSVAYLAHRDTMGQRRAARSALRRSWGEDSDVHTALRAPRPARWSDPSGWISTNLNAPRCWSFWGAVLCFDAMTGSLTRLEPWRPYRVVEIAVGGIWID